MTASRGISDLATRHSPRGLESFVRSCDSKPKRQRAKFRHQNSKFLGFLIHLIVTVFFFVTQSRVVLIFRVRSARRLAITDYILLKRLSGMILLYLSYLTVWMVIQPPSTESGVTTDKLKYKRCSTGWFGHILLAGKTLTAIF